MGTIIARDISQQTFLLALEQVLNSIIHSHAGGIYVFFLMSYFLWVPSAAPSPKLDTGF